MSQQNISLTTLDPQCLSALWV